MPIYVNIGGLKIKGLVSEKNHKDWIAVDNCDFDVMREVTEGTGAAKNREWKAPVVNAINFSKKVDDASGGLAKWACGEPTQGDGKVIVEMLRSGEQGMQPYLVYTMTSCILSKYSLSADESAEERGSEQFSISFLTIEMKFIEYDETGKGQSPVVFKYDLSKGVKA